MEFGVFGDLGLEKDRGFGGVEAGGQEVDGDLQGVFGDGGGVGVIAGEGVPVGYEIEAFVCRKWRVASGEWRERVCRFAARQYFILEADPVLERAEVVADVETSGGAHAGDYSVGGSGQVFASVDWLTVYSLQFGSGKEKTGEKRKRA